MSNWSSLLTKQKTYKNFNNLTTVDLNSFDTSNVSFMSNMFQGCSNFTTVYVKDQASYNKFTTVPTSTPSQAQFIIK